MIEVTNTKGSGTNLYFYGYAGELFCPVTSMAEERREVVFVQSRPWPQNADGSSFPAQPL